MSEQVLSVKQLEEVLGISYPTALKMAQDKGKKVPGSRRSRWVVPVDIVRMSVNAEIANSMRKLQRIDEIVQQ